MTCGLVLSGVILPSQSYNPGWSGRGPPLGQVWSGCWQSSAHHIVTDRLDLTGPDCRGTVGLTGLEWGSMWGLATRLGARTGADLQHDVVDILLQLLLKWHPLSGVVLTNKNFHTTKRVCYSKLKCMIAKKDIVHTISIPSGVERLVYTQSFNLLLSRWIYLKKHIFIPIIFQHQHDGSPSSWKTVKHVCVSKLTTIG